MQPRVMHHPRRPLRHAYFKHTYEHSSVYVPHQMLDASTASNTRTLEVGKCFYAIYPDSYTINYDKPTYL
jgi:hypothetical protein